MTYSFKLLPDVVGPKDSVVCQMKSGIILENDLDPFISHLHYMIFLLGRLIIFQYLFNIGRLELQGL